MRAPFFLSSEAPSARQPAARSVTPAPAGKAPGWIRDPGGKPAELFIILPPNLDQAIARGKVMLVFEAKGGRPQPIECAAGRTKIRFFARRRASPRKDRDVGHRRDAAVLACEPVSHPLGGPTPASYLNTIARI